MALTVQRSPGIMGKAQKVLKTAHRSIQTTTKAILPEEGAGIPSPKSPMELERNEGGELMSDVPECLDLRGKQHVWTFLCGDQNVWKEQREL